MLFFDIETEANQDAFEFMNEPKAPSNWKNPDKIKSYIEEKKQEQIEKAALDADYGRIVALGWKVDDKPIDSRLVYDIEDGYSEKELIQTFWNLYKDQNGYSCGYNIIGFDLPYLMRRSFDLGIIPGIFPNLAKYRTFPTLDLMMVLYNWSGFKSLKWVVKRYGLDNPLPELEGSQVKGMDDKTLRAYVENDVYLTYQLYERMKGIYF